MSHTDTEYAGMGIRWESEDVAIVYGDNQSDKRVVNEAAQIAVMTDVALFNAAFPGFILASSNGTSLRVICQRVGRKFNGKDIEANRKAVLDSIRGTRAKGLPQTKRAMPDGTFYHGNNEQEFRGLYAAALVDLGTPGELALAIAARLPW